MYQFPGELLQQVKDTQTSMLFITEECANKALQVQNLSNKQIRVCIL